MPQCAVLDAFIGKYEFGNNLERKKSCRLFWESIPEMERARLLFEILDNYRACRGRDEGARYEKEHIRESLALNELTTSFYLAK